VREGKRRGQAPPPIFWPRTARGGLAGSPTGDSDVQNSRLKWSCALADHSRSVLTKLL